MYAGVQIVYPTVKDRTIFMELAISLAKGLTHDIVEQLRHLLLLMVSLGNEVVDNWICKHVTHKLQEKALDEITADTDAPNARPLDHSAPFTGLLTNVTDEDWQGSGDQAS